MSTSISTSNRSTASVLRGGDRSARSRSTARASRIARGTKVGPAEGGGGGVEAGEHLGGRGDARGEQHLLLLLGGDEFADAGPRIDPGGEGEHFAGVHPGGTEDGRLVVQAGDSSASRSPRCRVATPIAGGRHREAGSAPCAFTDDGTAVLAPVAFGTIAALQRYHDEFDVGVLWCCIATAAMSRRKSNSMS